MLLGLRKASGEPAHKKLKSLFGSTPVGHLTEQVAGGIKKGKDAIEGTQEVKRSSAKDLRESPYFKFAAMSSAAYQGTNEQKLETLGKHLGENHTWNLNPSFTHRKTSVFHNHDTKEAVVAFRGTKCENGAIDCLTGDLGTDIALAVGLEHRTGRFKNSLQEFDTINTYYKNMGYTVSTTGHSLGGSLARYVHQEREGQIEEAHMFNPGTSLGGNTKLADGAFSHHVANDPVSLLGISKDPHVIVYDGISDENNLIDNHFMNNFFS